MATADPHFQPDDPDFTPDPDFVPDAPKAEATKPPEPGTAAAAKATGYKPSPVSAIGRGLAQGATMGFGDEATGALQAAGSLVLDPEKYTLTGDEKHPNVAQFLTSEYKKHRDAERAKDAAEREEHPVLTGLSDVAGSAPAAFASGGSAEAASLGRLSKMAQALNAANETRKGRAAVGAALGAAGALGKGGSAGDVATGTLGGAVAGASPAAGLGLAGLEAATTDDPAARAEALGSLGMGAAAHGFAKVRDAGIPEATGRREASISRAQEMAQDKVDKAQATHAKKLTDVLSTLESHTPDTKLENRIGDQQGQVAGSEKVVTQDDAARADRAKYDDALSKQQDAHKALADFVKNRGKATTGLEKLDAEIAKNQSDKAGLDDWAHSVYMRARQGDQQAAHIAPGAEALEPTAREGLGQVQSDDVKWANRRFQQDQLARAVADKAKAAKAQELDSALEALNKKRAVLADPNYVQPAKPISPEVRQAAYEKAKALGLDVGDPASFDPSKPPPMAGMPKEPPAPMTPAQRTLARQKAMLDVLQSKQGNLRYSPDEQRARLSKVLGTSLDDLAINREDPSSQPIDTDHKLRNALTQEQLAQTSLDKAKERTGRDYILKKGAEQLSDEPSGLGDAVEMAATGRVPVVKVLKSVLMSPDAPKGPAARAAYYDRLVQNLTRDRDMSSRYGTFLNSLVVGKGSVGLAHLLNAAEKDPELAKKVNQAALATSRGP